MEGRIEILNEKINLLQAKKEQQAEKIEALEKMIKSKNNVISAPGRITVKRSTWIVT